MVKTKCRRRGRTGRPPRGRARPDSDRMLAPGVARSTVLAALHEVQSRARRGPQQAIPALETDLNENVEADRHHEPGDRREHGEPDHHECGVQHSLQHWVIETIPQPGRQRGIPAHVDGLARVSNRIPGSPEIARRKLQFASSQKWRIWNAQRSGEVSPGWHQRGLRCSTCAEQRSRSARAEPSNSGAPLSLSCSSSQRP